ncbi:NAD-dependent epimerase/dehydratase family protein [Terasakiella sp. A23]|uniref:NAD-dependent epimerase/dehydratase family protein n=1 Tax=Terasakiella sp. FCG-A23 TaxID=3080561 RepID=UPI002955B4A2|nr:NAD-dependent epimerase/dehydratase family protein [Terasakiella sp. A23]MDV7339029.1 NAD-dependent epimerase/dehydratase family protein [Terasakiella sp. A23]
MIEEKILKELNGSNCVVTGGTGMIGAEVVRLLCDAGANVKSVSLDDLSADERAESVKADLTDISTCLDICQDMDFVFHVAGIKGSIEVTKSKPASFFTNLLMMNTNMLEAARRTNAKKVVYTSSIGAYSSAEVFVEDDDDPSKPPMDMFPGWAKRMAEMQVEAYQIQYGLENYAIVRPCNVYGPGDNFDPANAMVIPSLMARVDKGENPLLVWGDGSAVRDFAFTTDCAEGVIQALYHGTRGTYVNLGSGVGVTIRELVETLAQVTPFEYEFDTTKPAGFPRRVMDLTRARDWIGYNPQTSLLEGLRQTWDWYQVNKNASDKRHNYFTQD